MEPRTTTVAQAINTLASGDAVALRAGDAQVGLALDLGELGT